MMRLPASLRLRACVAFVLTLTLAGDVLAAAARTRTRTRSPVVRPAPDFVYTGVGGRKSLRSLRNQPVVLMVSRSPETRAFRKQLKALETIYQEFASRGTVFVAAFSEKEGQIPSNMPLVLAQNGPGVASAYGLRDDFVIAIIGRDGNLDLLTDRVLPAFRVREVIQNSYAVQSAARKEMPKGPPQPPQ